MTSIEAADSSLRQASRRLLPKVSVGEKGTLGLMALTVLLGLLSVVCLGTGAVSIGPQAGASHTRQRAGPNPALGF